MFAHTSVIFAFLRRSKMTSCCRIAWISQMPLTQIAVLRYRMTSTPSLSPLTKRYLAPHVWSLTILARASHYSTLSWAHSTSIPTLNLTVTKATKDHYDISDSDPIKIPIAKRSEIDFMLKPAVIPIPITDVPDHVTLQALKWVLAIKISSENESDTRHRTRLLSATHKSPMRHFVHRNAPTFMHNTLKMLAAILPM